MNDLAEVLIWLGIMALLSIISWLGVRTVDFLHTRSLIRLLSKDFPKRCWTCGLHRYGVLMGYEDSVEPPDHECGGPT